MKLSKKDKEHFTPRLHKLADDFNKATAVWKQKKPTTAAENKALQAIRAVSKDARELANEFYEHGYTREQWNRFITTSGVEKKMKPYGRAFAEISKAEALKKEAVLNKYERGPTFDEISAAEEKRLKKLADKKIKRINELNKR